LIAIITNCVLTSVKYDIEKLFIFVNVYIKIINQPKLRFNLLSHQQLL